MGFMMLHLGEGVPVVGQVFVDQGVNCCRGSLGSLDGSGLDMCFGFFFH